VTTTRALLRACSACCARGARRARPAARAQRPRRLSRHRLAPAAAAWGPCRGAGGRENARPSSRSRPLNILPHLVRLAGPRRATLAFISAATWSGCGRSRCFPAASGFAHIACAALCANGTLALVPLLCLALHAGQCFGDRSPQPTVAQPAGFYMSRVQCYRYRCPCSYV
jgi:hypothetical protein